MKKRALSFLVVVIMAFTLFPRSASPVAAADIYYGECGAEGDNLMWFLDEEEELLAIVGEGEMKDYSDDYGEYAPWFLDLRRVIKTVIIDEGVTSIGAYAFYGCQEAEIIYVPDSVISIGEHAFEGCTSLTYTYIPEGVERIGPMTFYWCNSLKSINIPESITYIGEDAFYDCRSIQYVSVTDLDKWNKVIFDGNSSYPLSYGGTLYVNGEPFDETYSGACGAGLTWTFDTLDKTLTISGKGDMKNYNIDSDPAPWNEYRRYAPIETVVINDGVTSIGNEAFYEFLAIKNVTIPDSVKSIGDGAFSKCASLKELTIPDSVTKIGVGAFYQCVDLQNIEIPAGLTRIEDRTFYWCDSLVSVIIPKSVTYIGVKAFEVCERLRTVYYEGSKADWDKITIREGNDYLKRAQFTYYYSPEAYAGEFGAKGNNLFWSLNLTTGVLTISGKGDMADFGNGSPWAPWNEHSRYIKKVVINDGVTNIGDRAFYCCYYIEDVEIPDSVKSIGNSAFDSCFRIKSIVIPGGVSSIKDSTFRNCTALQSVKIPDSVTTIEKYAFYYCYNLEEIEIPEGVTDIGADAFAYCSALKSIVIPASVTHIGMYAFVSCNALETVYFTGSEKQWNSIEIESNNDPLIKANIIFNYIPKTITPGDVNDDGTVNMKDVILIRQSLVGLTEIDPDPADVNGDGAVNMKDVILIRQYLVGIIDKFPA